MTARRDWPHTLWSVSYKGFPFFFDTADEAGALGLVIHKFPNRDDPFIEDMGEEPRFYSGSAYVHGDDADTQSSAFADTLVSHGPGPLVDPLRGPVLVRCQEWKRKHDKDKQGYIAFEVKFVREGAATGLISIPFLLNVAFRAANGLATAAASLSSFITLRDQPDFVVAAASDGVQNIAASIEALRVSIPVDPVVSATVRDAVTAIYQYAPDVISRAPSDAAVAALIAAVPAFAPVPTAPEDVAAAAIIATVRALADGTPPLDAAPAMISMVDAWRAVEDSNPLSPLSLRAAANAAAVARLARLAALTAWAEALIQRDYASRPDGVTARAEASARFEDELETLSGAAAAPITLAVVNLRGQVTEYLSRLINDLAPVITIDARRSMPSLWWANRLYADPLRAGELVARNAVSHPSFMPLSFSALAR